MDPGVRQRGCHLVYGGLLQLRSDAERGPPEESSARSARDIRAGLEKQVNMTVIIIL